MDEKEFFNESLVTKPYSQPCPFCGNRAEYQVRWIERKKKSKPPAGANAEDIQRFKASRSYMLRQDDLLACKNNRCRKRFEIGSQQSVVFLE